jgi:hypothetical protein
MENQANSCKINDTDKTLQNELLSSQNMERTPRTQLTILFRILEVFHVNIFPKKRLFTLFPDAKKIIVYVVVASLPPNMVVAPSYTVFTAATMPSLTASAVF